MWRKWNLLAAVFLVCASFARTTEGPSRQRQRRRAKFLWAGDLALEPPSAVLSLHTLTAHNGKRTAAGFDVDVTLLVPELPVSPSVWSQVSALTFQVVTTAQWKEVVLKKLGVHLAYDVYKDREKLSDFFPMLAYLFPETVPLDEFDFWMYGRLDGFFGNIFDIL